MRRTLFLGMLAVMVGIAGVAATTATRSDRAVAAPAEGEFELLVVLEDFFATYLGREAWVGEFQDLAVGDGLVAANYTAIVGDGQGERNIAIWNRDVDLAQWAGSTVLVDYDGPYGGGVDVLGRDVVTVKRRFFQSEFGPLATPLFLGDANSHQSEFMGSPFPVNFGAFGVSYVTADSVLMGSRSSIESFQRNPEGAWTQSTIVSPNTADIRNLTQIGELVLFDTQADASGLFQFGVIDLTGSTQPFLKSEPGKPVVAGSDQIALSYVPEPGFGTYISTYDLNGRFWGPPEAPGLSPPSNSPVHALAVDSTSGSGHRIAAISDGSLWILDIPQSLGNVDWFNIYRDWYQVPNFPVPDDALLDADNGLVVVGYQDDALLQTGDNDITGGGVVYVFGKPLDGSNPLDPMGIGVEVPAEVDFLTEPFDPAGTNGVEWPECLANVGTDPILRLCFNTSADREIYITAILTAAPRPPDEVIWIGSYEQEPVKP